MRNQCVSKETEEPAAEKPKRQLVLFLEPRRRRQNQPACGDFSLQPPQDTAHLRDQKGSRRPESPHAVDGEHSGDKTDALPTLQDRGVPCVCPKLANRGPGNSFTERRLKDTPGPNKRHSSLSGLGSQGRGRDDCTYGLWRAGRLPLRMAMFQD